MPSTAMLGREANAGLLGFGVFARSDARQKSPDPQYSGRSQNSGEQHQAAGDPREAAAVGPEQPERVQEDERPRLRAQHPGGDPERERLRAVAGDVALDAPRRRRDQQPLGVAEQRVAHEPGRAEQEEGREHAARDAAEARAEAEAPRRAPAARRRARRAATATGAGIAEEREAAP